MAEDHDSSLASASLVSAAADDGPAYFQPYDRRFLPFHLLPEPAHHCIVSYLNCSGEQLYLSEAEKWLLPSVRGEAIISHVILA